MPTLCHTAHIDLTVISLPASLEHTTASGGNDSCGASLHFLKAGRRCHKQEGHGVSPLEEAVTSGKFAIIEFPHMLIVLSQ